MSLKSRRELAITREKLNALQKAYDAIRSETGDDQELRRAELESLKRLINQFMEEIGRTRHINSLQRIHEPESNQAKPDI